MLGSQMVAGGGQSGGSQVGRGPVSRHLLGIVRQDVPIGLRLHTHMHLRDTIGKPSLTGAHPEPQVYSTNVVLYYKTIYSKLHAAASGFLFIAVHENHFIIIQVHIIIQVLGRKN